MGAATHTYQQTSIHTYHLANGMVDLVYNQGGTKTIRFRDTGATLTVLMSVELSLFKLNLIANLLASNSSIKEVA